MAHKRRRLPNGFGQISEIKGKNLRKPFRAMVTTGKDEYGRPICKLLKPESYFKTYNEAYMALMKYNENPYDPTDSITMAQLFNLWYADYKQSGRAESTIRGVGYVWAYCSSIYDFDVRRVRQAQIYNCLEKASVSRNGSIIPITPYLIRSCKSIMNMLFEYAVEHGITDRNYAKDASLPDHVAKDLRENTKHHLNYTDNEMQILWENVDKYPIISTILIQCYSGWRPMELLTLRIENVDLENWTFKGGMKTEAGKDRIVPIHTRIRPLVKQYYEQATANGCEYLLCKPERSIRAAIVPISYKVYVKSLGSLSSHIAISAEHKPHDGRVQFVTMAKLHDVSEYAIKLIVGHSIQDLTERVYTRRSLEWLRTEIEKIK